MPPRRQPPHEPRSETIRLVVVEDRSVLGAGVREVLQNEQGIEVVGEARTPAEAIPVVGRAAPDVILVNLAPEEPEAAAAARQLHRDAPNSAMIVLGGADDDASIVEALEVGATGHVAERADPAELVETIRRVAEGDDQLKDEISSRPDIVERIVDVVRQSIDAEVTTASPLSEREVEILRLVASGERNQEIADHLGIGIQTVKNHLARIMHRLGVPNRTRAVTYAVRHGWLELDDPTDAHTRVRGR